MSSFEDLTDLDEPSQESLVELKRLLYGEEQDKLVRLEQSLNNPEILARKLSRVLPDAIVIRSQKDSEISRALMPAIEDEIRELMPEKPITFGQSFKNKIASINKTIDNNFSWRGIKWEIQSLFSRKSFAEIAVANTVIYQVDFVFLIRKKTGGLLQYVVSKHAPNRSPRLVSELMKTIQVLIKKSFEAENNQKVDTMKVGDLTIWLEEGPHAYMASLIRGIPPQQYRSVMKEILDRIHVKMWKDFDGFNGNTNPFVKIQSYLKQCLKVRLRKEAKRTRIVVGLFWISLFLGLISAFGFFAFSKYKFINFVNQVNSQPGIVVSSSSQWFGNGKVSGLRDPLSKDPRQLAMALGLNADKINFNFEPFESSIPEFVEYRENLKKFDELKSKIESTEIVYPDDYEKMRVLRDQLDALQPIALKLNKTFRLMITGPQADEASRWLSKYSQFSIPRLSMGMDSLDTQTIRFSLN